MIRLLKRLWRKYCLGIREYRYTNIYDSAQIGRNCVIGSYTEIGQDVRIGNNCKIGAMVFIPKGVTIEDDVFIGPKVCFVNDKYPKAHGEWEVRFTRIRKGASIGANSTILCGTNIGAGAMIGAGSVVTHDVPESFTVCGNPARAL
jgi:UDP-2-acetamido-3-amino-2,3-dideoxy-glucuronate N-acetyltransferase